MTAPSFEVRAHEAKQRGVRRYGLQDLVDRLKSHSDNVHAGADYAVERLPCPCAMSVLYVCSTCARPLTLLMSEPCEHALGLLREGDA